MKNTFVSVNVGVKNDKKWAFPGSFTLAGSGYTRFAPGALLCVMADSIRHLEPNGASLRPKGLLSLTRFRVSHFALRIYFKEFLFLKRFDNSIDKFFIIFF